MRKNNNAERTTTAIRKSGFGALLTGKYIFEVPLFAGNSVVKFPPLLVAFNVMRHAMATLQTQTFMQETSR
jgi:hypothetical protein